MVGANADLVKAVRWVSTLDTHTTPMCRIRDGLQYTPDGHQPIGHSVPWGDGPGRLHPDCRSVSAQVVKSWRELGLDIEDMKPGTRASMGGQVPADLTYNQWFVKQSADVQREILGAQRFKLYQSGKVKVDHFYTDVGTYRSLEELFAKYGD